MENQLEKGMEYEMETWFRIGFMEFILHDVQHGFQIYWRYPILYISRNLET